MTQACQASGSRGERRASIRWRPAGPARSGGRTVPRPPRRRGGGFTLIELLVVIAILGLLAALLMPVLSAARQRARRVPCMNNMKQFAAADMLYLADYERFPEPSPYVPSSIRTQRLAIVAKYLGLPLPDGPIISWPKRPKQPRWINCPRAVNSGLAEGPTLGGGLYTGYAYYGGIEESTVVMSGMARVLHPGHAADLRNTRRGVLWADVLDEFATSEERRFEFFHHVASAKYPDFRFHANELEGIHRTWSDGSVEWLAGKSINLTGANSDDLQLRHTLGNYYY